MKNFISSSALTRLVLGSTSLFFTIVCSFFCGYLLKKNNPWWIVLVPVIIVYGTLFLLSLIKEN